MAREKAPECSRGGVGWILKSLAGSLRRPPEHNSHVTYKTSPVGRTGIRPSPRWSSAVPVNLTKLTVRKGLERS